MKPIKEEGNEENEEMIGRVVEERSPNEDNEAGMVGEVEKEERGIFGVTNPDKVEVTGFWSFPERLAQEDEGRQALL